MDEGHFTALLTSIDERHFIALLQSIGQQVAFWAAPSWPYGNATRFSLSSVLFLRLLYTGVGYFNFLSPATETSSCLYRLRSLRKSVNLTLFAPVDTLPTPVNTMSTPVDIMSTHANTMSTPVNAGRIIKGQQYIIAVSKCQDMRGCS
jgi:hypothetical protein